MQNDKLDMLNPHLMYQGFNRLERRERQTEGVRERFQRFYAGMREEGALDYERARRLAQILA